MTDSSTLTTPAHLLGADPIPVLIFKSSCLTAVQLRTLLWTLLASATAAETMRRNDSSSGEMQDAADTIPAVDSTEMPMEVTKSKHVKIPPPNITQNGIKSASVSPQQPFGRQSRPQSANRVQFGGNKGPGAPVRYFILKSTNRENVERSIEQGVWSTQRHNEQKLREAFEQSKDVFLIFSVNSSGHFQGYARMVSIGQGQGTRNQWEGATQNLGLNFNIEWQRRYELPFQETEALRNPLNEDKPVKISRDGQELPPDIGEALVQLFEEGAERTGVPRPARVRIGAPNAGRMNGQQGMMGRVGGRSNPGRGRGGPDMMTNGPIMPTPGFMGDMGMAPMNAFLPMGPMGQPHMMMGMDPMAMGSMAGFDGDFRMPNVASMGMAMNPMGNPMMGMGMGMGAGDMGPAFPMAMPPPRPPPRRPLDEGMNSRPGPASRPYSSDRIYDDDRVDDCRDQPGRSGYSRYCKDPSKQHDSSSMESLLPGSPVFYAVT